MRWIEPSRRPASLCPRAVVVLASLLAMFGVGPAGAATPPPLRVCADPNNLPFSDRSGGGFENELATMLARDLGRSLEYTWWPQRRGFIRSTLKAGHCDVVMGLPAGFELAELTAPYYASGYVFVVRRGSGLETLRTLDDPRLRHARIGLHTIGDDYANVPPAEALATRGIVGNVTGYSIYGDYSRPNPPTELLDALARGKVDVAIAWGPLAGWFAAQSRTPLIVRPIEPASDRPEPVPLAYAVAMGVRKGDEALRAQLQGALQRHAADVTRLLRKFGVPLVWTPHAGSARGDERLYVTNERSGDLTVVDPLRSTVVATLPLGKRPRGIQQAPDGRLYVALSGSPIAGPGVDETSLPPPDRSADGIGIVDLEPLRLERVLRGPSDPEQLAPGRGSRVFVASEDGGTAIELDATSGATIATRTVGAEPEGIALRPGGHELYVASEAGNRITVIDTAHGATLARIDVCARPRGIVFARRAGRAYVSCENDATVDVVDVSRHAVVASWHVPGVNARPMGLALAPDESTLYVTTGRGRTLVAFEARTGRFRGSVEAGARPWGVTLSRDGRTVYTANGPSNDVSVIDAKSLVLLQKIAVGRSPWGLVAVPATSAATTAAVRADVTASAQGDARTTR